MALHTDKNGKLHDDMDGAARQFFPAELGPYTQVTDEEAAAIRISQLPQPDPQIAIDTSLKALKSTRESILNRLQGIAFAAQLEGDAVTTAAYLVARQGLLDITANLPDTLPEVEALVVQRYQAIIEQIGEGSLLVTAFAGMDV